MELTRHSHAARLLGPPVHHYQGQLLPPVLQVGVVTQGAGLVLTFPPVHVDHEGSLTFHFGDVEAFPGQIGTWSKFCVQALFGRPFCARLTGTLGEGQHQNGVDANIQQKHGDATLVAGFKMVVILPKRKCSVDQHEQVKIIIR